MTYREFLSRVERALTHFKEAQDNEGVEPGDDIDEDDLLSELNGHLEDEVSRVDDDFA